MSTTPALVTSIVNRVMAGLPSHDRGFITELVTLGCKMASNMQLGNDTAIFDVDPSRPDIVDFANEFVDSFVVSASI